MLIRLSKRLTTASNCCVQRHKSDWNLSAAVCLQRRPKITPEMNWLEKKVDTILARLETSRSLYSDHEMRHFEDLRRAERIASGDKLDEQDLDLAAKQTAQDFDDTSAQELSQFVKASRLTHSDEINDRKSLNRCLDRHLMFICRQKMGEKNVWLLPNVLRADGETLRETAERALQTIAGNQLRAKFLGNAPSCVYQYLYPRCVRDEMNAKGVKIFTFKATLEKGDVCLNSEFADDYQWLNRNELAKVLFPQFWKQLSKSLLIEELDLTTIMNKNRVFKHIIQKKYAVSQ